MRRRYQAAGLARPDERRRQVPHLSWVQHANECSRCPTVKPAFMFMKMALYIWKWRFAWPLRIFSMPVGNDFQQPRGNQGMRHFQCPAVHLLRGGTCVERRRPAQAVGALAWLQLDVSGCQPVSRRRRSVISMSSSGVRSKITRCQTRTGSDHPLPLWTAFPPGHQRTSEKTCRISGPSWNRSAYSMR